MSSPTPADPPPLKMRRGLFFLLLGAYAVCMAGLVWMYFRGTIHS